MQLALRTIIPVILAVALLPSPLGATATTTDAETGAERSTRAPRAALFHAFQRSDDPAGDVRDAVRSRMGDLVGIPTSSSSGPIYDGEAYLLNGGDFDGDGRDDGLEISFLLGNRFMTEIAAVRATDGAVLWQQAVEGFAWARAAGDLDGDDLADIFVFDDTYEPAYAGASDVDAYSEVYQITTRAVSVDRGADIWAAPRSGTGAFAYIDHDWERGVAAIAGASFPVSDGHDLDGDGATDLLVGSFAGAYAWDDEAETFNGVDAVSSFELVSGRTGASRTVFPASAGYAEIAAVPDLTGDDLPDVAILTLGGLAPSVAAYPGTGGPRKWSAGVPEDLSWAWPSGADLDGDGTGDVLVHGRSLAWDDEEEDYLVSSQRLSALSGIDGTTAWTAETPPWSDGVVAGDATGDGGDDVLVVTSEDDDRSLFGHHVGGGDEMWLLHGDDGSTVWKRRIARLRWMSVAGDLTGDGVIDALVHRFARLTVNGRRRTVRAVSVYSGVTGSARWTVPATRGWMLPLGGDLNDDGAGDLAWFKGGGAYRAMSGRTGRSLWRRDVGTGGYLLLLGVARTNEGGDILESAIGSGWSSMITSMRAGDTGSLWWRRTRPFDGWGGEG
ncbi:MAG TPA: hypothetical protein VM638_05715 [Actinomycetota bacterium]|nr:hypothetical protein [Actinomycetota bacterium]